MNGQIKTLALTALISGLIVSACNTSNKGKGNNEAMTANDTTMQPIAMDTQNNWQQDWEKFKADSRAKIKENDDSIEAFRVRVDKGKSKMKVQYDKDIEDLKRKSEALRVKLDSFKEKSKEKWDRFETDFNNDMDTLSIKVKDLTKK